jgi:hypothetical protein
VRHNSIPATVSDNILAVPEIKSPKKNDKNKDSVDSSSVSKTERKNDIRLQKADYENQVKLPAETTDNDQTPNSNVVSVAKNMSEIISSLKTKENPDQTEKSEEGSDIEINKQSQHGRKESLPIPLELVKTEVKEFPKQKNSSKEDLGVIMEEHSQTHSTIYQFNQPKQKSLNSNLGYNKAFTKKNSVIRPDFLNSLKSGKLRDNSSQNKNSASKDKDKDDVMKDAFDTLKKLSTSNNDLKEMSEEFSKASESNFFYKNNNSSYISHKKRALKDNNANTDPFFKISGFKKSDKDSGLQSISSIFGDSSNNVNPEEKINEGVLISHINSAIRPGTLNLDYLIYSF